MEEGLIPMMKTYVMSGKMLRVEDNPHDPDDELYWIQGEILRKEKPVESYTDDIDDVEEYYRTKKKFIRMKHLKPQKKKVPVIRKGIRMKDLKQKKIKAFKIPENEEELEHFNKIAKQGIQKKQKKKKRKQKFKKQTKYMREYVLTYRQRRAKQKERIKKECPPKVVWWPGKK